MTNYQRNFSTGEVEVERDGSTLYHKTEYRERRDHFAFYNVNADRRGLRHRPRDRSSASTTTGASRRSPAKGQSSNSVASGWAADRVARPRRQARARARRRRSSSRSATSRTRAKRSGRSRASSTRSRAHALIAKFSQAGAGRRGDEALADHWSKLLSNYSIESGDEKLNRTVNIWNPYQCMVTFNMSRTRLVLRDGHRPRHGLPRLEPGPARASCTWCPSARASASSTSRRRSSPTAARTTSTSRSPSAATTTSAAASTTIRSG